MPSSEIGNSSPHSFPGESEGETIARLLEAARNRPLSIVPIPLEVSPLAVLSEPERAVINATVEAWNAFLLLPHEHPDDPHEFRRAIHTLQSIILQRPARRWMNSGSG